jgi:ribosome biogenesis GTPase
LPGETGHWVLIEDLKERRSVIIRKDVSGRTSKNQILAANVDVLFIVTSANADLNLNRIARYLALVAAEDIQSVILLNKIELCTEREKLIAEMAERFPQTRIFGVSALQSEIAPLKEFIRPGQTVSFVGSSGVGKSSLINAILGSQRMLTSEIRHSDSKGRHTTTHRELLLTETGCSIIDTPGLRSVGLTEESDISSLYEDIELLISNCRFHNCRHVSEPGCAVQESLAAHKLSEDRWTQFRHMEKEILFEKRKSDKALQSKQKKEWAKKSSGLRKRER